MLEGLEKNDLTLEALDNPQVGDRFHEMYSYWMFVLAVKPEVVTYISASAPCTFPEDGKVETISRDDFFEKFTYQSREGAWVRLKDRGNNVSGWLSEDVNSYYDEEFLLS